MSTNVAVRMNLAARAARLDAQRQRQAILRAQRRNQVELNEGVDDAPLPSLFERIFGRPRANPAGPSPAARPPPRVVLPSTMRERFAAAVRARAVADAAAVAALVPHRARVVLVRVSFTTWVRGHRASTAVLRSGHLRGLDVATRDERCWVLDRAHLWTLSTRSFCGPPD